MMDERNRYNKVKRLLEPIVGQTLHIEKLRRRVMIDIGSSEAVVYETLRFMIDLGLITETEPYMFKVLRAEADL